MSESRQPGSNSRAEASVPVDSQPAWAIYSAVLARAEPLGRHALCTQMAATSFVGHRARAQFDLATRVTTCRSPQDFVAAQTDFWHQAGRDYMDFATQVVGLWQLALNLTPPQTDPVGAGASATRDLLWVPDAAASPREAAQPAAARKAA